MATAVATDTVAALRKRGSNLYHERLTCAQYGGDAERVVVSDAGVLARMGGRACLKCWTGAGYVPLGGE